MSMKVLYYMYYYVMCVYRCQAMVPVCRHVSVEYGFLPAIEDQNIHKRSLKDVSNQLT